MRPKIVDSDHAAAKARLLADLRLLREESGQPSLSQLVKLSGHKFSKSTLDDQLSGRRSKLPSWRFVAAYVEACHAAASSTGLEVSRFGTIEQWRSLWLWAFRGEERTEGWSAEKARQIVSSPSPPLEGAIQRSIEPAERSMSTASFEAFIDQAELSELRNIPNNTGVLIIRNDVPNDTARFPVSGDLVTIGRAIESDVWLDHDSVSRRHAIIRRDKTRFSVQDVGSINGTYLDQERLTAEARLKSSQELQIGIFRLLFVQGKRRGARSGQ